MISKKFQITIIIIIIIIIIKIIIISMIECYNDNANEMYSPFSFFSPWYPIPSKR